MSSEQLISWFYQRKIERSLNLNPKYQRKPVWSRRNQQYLIDTIIRKLPVPEIYMQTKTSPEGKSEYIIIDGQQRLRAVLEFLDGEFEISEEDNPEYANKYFADLPTGIQQEFWSYVIQVRDIKTNSDAEIRAIFQRMNKNVVPLNEQEIRNATYIGHFVTLMNQLAEEQQFFSENGIFTANDIKRMRDAEFISELFITLMHGIQNKDDTIDDYYRRYDSVWTDKEDVKKEYNRIITLISDLFSNLKGTRWKIKSDFYSLFYALYELNKEYIIPAEKYEDIRSTLLNLSDRVITESENSSDQNIKEYYNSILAHTNDKTHREIRNRILRQMIIPFLIARDKKRNFTEEERMVIWAKSNKKCALCKKNLIYSEFCVDHIYPYNKGGKTILENSQALCISCNSKKSDDKTPPLDTII